MRLLKEFYLSILLLLPVFGAVLCYGLHSNAVAENLDAQASSNINAVLLMDSSASMLTNDPAKLRDEGARLLLQFLKPGDRLAIVSFDETAKVVRPLSPFSSDQLPALQSALSSIAAVGQYTDLNAGLQSAQSILSKLPADDGKPVIILLSDGKMDPAPASGSADFHLDQLSTRLLPSLKASNTKVYTLAFSQDADRPLLQHIAQSSDGINWFTPNSDTIHESFADLFLSLKKPQVVPYGSRGFKIDADVEEATFYINQPEDVRIEIEDPDNDRFSAQKPGENIRWFDGKKFSVITISRPAAGEWKIIGVNPDDGFATILTNLKLVTDWPNAVLVGENTLLQARLYEGKIPVDLEAMAQAVNFVFEITPSDKVSEPVVRDFLNDEGKQGDETAKDGTFSQLIKLPQSGAYRLRLIAKGPTFERQLQIPFRVRPPLLQLSIDLNSPEKSHADEHVQSHADQVVSDSHASSNSHVDSEEHANSEGHTNSDGHTAKQAVTEETLASKSTPHKKNIIEGSQNSIFNVALNAEVSTLKNVSVTIFAVDKDRKKYSLIASPEGQDDAHKASAHGADSHGEKNKDHKKQDGRSDANKGAGVPLLYQASAEALPKDGLFELKAVIEAKSRDGKQLSEESDVVRFVRKTVVELGAKEINKHVVEAKSEEKTSKHKDSPALSVLIVTAVNIILAALVFLLLKKKKARAAASESFELPSFSPQLLSDLEELERRVQLDSVDLEDDRYLAGEGDAASLAGGSSKGAGVEASGSAV